MAKWYDAQPSPRDQRRTDPVHPPKPPAKKDKTRWCRGKVGVDHVWKVMVPANTDGWFIGRPCSKSVYYTGSGDMVREWTRFLCKHRIVCASCGKVRRRATQAECESGVLDPP
jgi:hypothetical protein